MSASMIGSVEPAPSAQRHFHIHHCLGRGGFGEVYRATMTSPGGLGSEVAIKVLRLDVNPGHEAVRRLRDEARLLAVLKHPAILKAHDLAVLNGQVALVTEYVEGEDFHRCLSGPDRMPPRAAFGTVALVAEALHVAFATVPPGGTDPLRLVHRDVKPSNIRLSTHGEVKLLDFGIAWSTGPDREARTGTNTTVGSLAYMSPERFGKQPLRSATDIYALGATLYEALVGTRLYADATPIEMYQRAADRGIHDAYLAEQLAAIPEGPGRDLLREMLSWSPDDRPEAAAVAARCEKIAEDLPGLHLRAWCRQRRWAPPERVEGHLEGRQITEGTMSSDAVPMAPSIRAGMSSQSDETFDMVLTRAEPRISRIEPTGSVSTSRERERIEQLPPDPLSSEVPRIPDPPGFWTPIRAAAATGLACVALVGSLLVAFGMDFSDPPVEPPPVEPPPVKVLVEPPPVAPPDPPVEPPPVEPPPIEPPPVAVVTPEPPKPVKPVKPTKPVKPVVPVLAQLPDPPPRPPDPPVPPPDPPAEPGRVRVIGEPKSLELRGAKGKFAAGSVPSGTYTIYADLGGGPRSQGSVEVPAGGQVTIECNSLAFKCGVAR